MVVLLVGVLFFCCLLCLDVSCLVIDQGLQSSPQEAKAEHVLFPVLLSDHQYPRDPLWRAVKKNSFEFFK